MEKVKKVCTKTKNVQNSMYENAKIYKKCYTKSRIVQNLLYKMLELNKKVCTKKLKNYKKYVQKSKRVQKSVHKPYLTWHFWLRSMVLMGKNVPIFFNIFFYLIVTSMKIKWKRKPLKPIRYYSCFSNYYPCTSIALSTFSRKYRGTKSMASLVKFLLATGSEFASKGAGNFLYVISFVFVLRMAISFFQKNTRSSIFSWSGPVSEKGRTNTNDASCLDMEHLKANLERSCYTVPGITYKIV